MNCITYEMFGAKGDGVHDDMSAIQKAHDEANRLSLPVIAKKNAKYYISPRAITAEIQTSTDWTGAEFVIDDVNPEDFQAPVFLVKSALPGVPFSVSALKQGQTHIPNPYRAELYIKVFNENHSDYIRKGLNQNNGVPRRDSFLLLPDGSLSSPVSFDFDCITSAEAKRIDTDTLTLTGGTFTTIANQAESKYNYHARNIEIRRSNVTVDGITHFVTGEPDHGAPYRGFLSIIDSAHITVKNCLFTGHKTYMTIGNASLPVPMGSYDINIDSCADVTFLSCRQTTDIMDKAYWGLIGSNFCRDLTLKDCVFSRFDAHMGVTNCRLINCVLGYQCINAIGFGTFYVENTRACGRAFINLRSDYGSTWRGDMIIKNSVWQPLTRSLSIFAAENDGTHDFGYECFLPENVLIDGLVIEETGLSDKEAPVYVFNDYLKNTDAPDAEKKYLPKEAKRAKIRNIHSSRRILLSENEKLFQDTEFICK
ncbi:MAG: hypothetical protein IJC48_09170 [Clostridia bacterium]|nr:hypothetical protein [Clostridia bacterium]